jgi:chromate transporter
MLPSPQPVSASDDPATVAEPAPRGSPLEVFATFLRLGLTSFGGPVAHLGYFRAELVERRRWVDDRAFAELVALCQFLPGPSSSQVGFALGLMRAGPLGALAAWTAFTLPSAGLMVLAGFGADLLGGRWGQGLIHGLKLAAVAVVAQAVYGMARALAPDRARAALAVLALALVSLLGGGLAQLAALALGCLAGLWLCRGPAEAGEGGLRVAVPRPVGALSLGLFFVLLLGLPTLYAATGWRPVQVADAFYRAGALVFGGGHVVLPLLQAQVVAPGWVEPNRFLAGYALAQALPGPLFSFSAYLGAVLRPGPDGLAGAALALVSIFLPGLLALIGVLPFWRVVRAQPAAQAAMRGANAAMMGVLAAALYSPVWTGSVHGSPDVAVAAMAFVALTAGRVAPLWVVAACAALGVAAIAVR